MAIDLAHVSTLLGESNNKVMGKRLVCATLGDGEALDRAFEVVYREGLATARGPDRFVSRIHGPEVAAHFRGTLILIATTKVYSSRFTLDFEAADLTHALDGICLKGDVFLMEAGLIERKAERKRQGVRLTKIEGETEPRYEEVQVPLKHPVFKKGAVCGA